MYKYIDVEELKGKVFAEIKNNEDEILFICENGETYKMFHEQSCCESVTIEDIVGNLANLVGEPILMAQEVSHGGENEWGTETWTYYKFATRKGYVTIRWYGSSNGYYSERVCLVKMTRY